MDFSSIFGPKKHLGDATPLFGTFSEARVLDATWPPQGSLLTPRGLPLGSLWVPLPPFWLPLAPFWLPLAPFWLPFGALWLPFGSLWLPLGPFGSLLAPLRLRFRTFGPSACEIFSKIVFLGTRDRQSTADSRWHPHQRNPRRSTSSF